MAVFDRTQYSMVLYSSNIPSREYNQPSREEGLLGFSLAGRIYQKLYGPLVPNLGIVLVILVQICNVPML